MHGEFDSDFCPRQRCGRETWSAGDRGSRSIAITAVPLKADAESFANNRQTHDLRRYLAVLLITMLAATVALCWWGSRGGDHFLALQEGDQDWYRDFAGRHVAEIQDQEILYHNIGHSIEWARQADIIILGSSQVQFALDRDSLLKFGEKHHLKIYNMALVGVRSGEFLRQIIQRWNIRPKLWIINVDDYFIPFFSRSTDLTFGPMVRPIPALNESRVGGFVNVASRNLRWRFEDWVVSVREGKVTPGGMYRNIKTGEMDVSSDPKYLAENNKPLAILRDQDCHATPEARQYGREFLTEIGGRALFMLVPHSQMCTLQAQELGASLGVEVLTSTETGFSTIDDGGHFDKKSSLKYTPFLLSAIENSEAFKEVINATERERF
jgi:hypothetical protein